MIKKQEAIFLTDIAETQYRTSMEGQIEEFCNGFVSAQIALATKERKRSVTIEVPKHLDYFKVRTHIQINGGFTITGDKIAGRARLLEICW